MAIFTPELLLWLKRGYYFWPTFFVIFTAYFTINYFLDLSRRIKCLKWIQGPVTLPIVGNALSYIGLSSSALWKVSLDLLDKYDGLAQIWIFHRPTVIISKPEYVEKMLKGNADTLMKKSEQYRFLADFIGGGILTSSGVLWHEKRKMLNPCFNQELLVKFVPSLCLHSRSLVSHLREKAINSEIVDYQVYSKLSALDIIMDALLEVSPNFLKNPDLSYTKAINTTTDVIVKRSCTPLYNWNFYYFFTITRWIQAKAASTINNFAKKIIEKRKKAKEGDTNQPENGDLPNRRHVLLDYLLANKDKYSLSDKDIQQEVNTFLFAGHDTVATGIAFTLYLIGRHPEIQERLFQEIKKVLPDLSKEKEPTSSDLNKLELLGRCIKEGLRLYPPVPWLGRALKNDIKIDDTCVFPHGTNVAINIYKLHRDEKHYKNPDEFNPDRFVSENIDDGDNFAYIPFGAGWRNCIGQKFATLEMKIIISHILNEFKVTSVDKPEDLQITGNVILRTNNGIRLRFKSRKE